MSSNQPDVAAMKVGTFERLRLFFRPALPMLAGGIVLAAGLLFAREFSEELGSAGPFAAAPSLVPKLVGASSLLVALFLGMAIRQAQVARDRARQAELASSALAEEMFERERIARALRRSEDQYRTLAANLPDAMVLLFDSDFRYLLAEGPLLTSLGIFGKGLVGKLLGERAPQEMARDLLPLYRLALAGESGHGEFQLGGRWLAVKTVPVGRGTGMALVQEITEHRLAEEELRATARRLELTNRELEDFAHIASHDLREPLRKVQAFGQRLLEHSGAALDEQGQDSLRRMLGASARMRALIDGLLDFSQITSGGKRVESCDLNAVAAQVVSDLELRISETGASVEIGTLPSIEADPLQMRQLFQNLLANSLKFTEPGQKPVVRVAGLVFWDGSRRICELEFSDAGIGFEPEAAGRIFTVFQRLHGRSAYEGSGIGLAICRKIARQHGGEISAKSTPGGGATFVVQLPVEQPRAAAEERGG